MGAMQTDVSREDGLIRGIYDTYNGRDLERLSAFLSDDVDWPDGDVRLRGVAAVRDYWTRQWGRIHTHDRVVGIADAGSGRRAVRIRQVVRDLGGEIISGGEFEHTYEFSGGLVRRMDLRKLQSDNRGETMIDTTVIVRELYASFNDRNIPAAVALMAEQVEWANGLNGGHVHGREEVRAYWTKQWAAIKPHVDPLDIAQREDGATAVEVHQIVHDLNGTLLLDEKVRHIFRIERGLVVRFDIENAGGLSALAHD